MICIVKEIYNLFTDNSVEIIVLAGYQALYVTFSIFTSPLTIALAALIIAAGWFPSNGEHTSLGFARVVALDQTLIAFMGFPPSTVVLFGHQLSICSFIIKVKTT